MAARKSRRPRLDASSRSPTAPGGGAEERPLRIIGGALRGRKLAYSGDPQTRPMKDRVREAVFNLLGTDAKGKHAIDLFAGTGALGLEALSRGAAKATFYERHFPTAALIERNIADLGLSEASQVVAANTFIQFRAATAIDLPADPPWLVFCSPPWSFFSERHDELLQVIHAIRSAAPANSVLIVESDRALNADELPDAAGWDERNYPPARIFLFRVP